MLEIADLMQVRGGKGVVNILAADKLMNSPKLYSSFLLWLLAELFEQLPEVGDPEKPKLVFFFDEAHLLFDEAPKALLEKVEQVVRLIRSKGVGVYFVTQNPLDVPESVLGQLGNRVQHALRAFTPRDQKAVKTAAETLRPNPKLKAEKVITELGVGEALVSLLDEKGRPHIVERAFIVPPASQLGPIAEAERQQALRSSPLFMKYEKAIDRESAYEKLKDHAEEKQAPAAAEPAGAKPDFRHPFRQDRPARRPADPRRARGGDQERGARHRLGARPADPARSARLDPRRRPPSLTERPRTAAWGIMFALVGVLAFSFRPILIKLSYGAHPVSPVTLLFLRMTLSLPFFLAIGWWLRNQEPRLERRDWLAIAGLGFIGYYAASFLDFIGLQWVGAGVGRLILYLFPTLVVLLSFLFPAQAPDLARNRRAGGELCRNRARGLQPDRGREPAVRARRGCSCSPPRCATRSTSSPAARWSSAWARCASPPTPRSSPPCPRSSSSWSTESAQSLQLPGAVWGYAIVLATVSTVLPLFLQAEALNRIGANHFALIGAIGPVSVAVTSALGLDEPFTWVQALGGALVIFGVLLVSLKERLSMDLGIRGKTALVCAASKGLGKGCAMALAREGVNLVITARGAEALEATAAEIRKNGKSRSLRRRRHHHRARS